MNYSTSWNNSFTSQSLLVRNSLEQIKRVNVPRSFFSFNILFVSFLCITFFNIIFYIILRSRNKFVLIICLKRKVQMQLYVQRTLVQKLQWREISHTYIFNSVRTYYLKKRYLLSILRNTIHIYFG